MPDPTEPANSLTAPKLSLKSELRRMVSCSMHEHTAHDETRMRPGMIKKGGKRRGVE